MEDTAVHRMNLHAVKIAVSKDTAAAGISMRNPNDPNCRQCELARFDSKGRAVVIFDNSQTNEGRIFKRQYVYDDQYRIKHVLHFVKNLTEEYDTAYHMTSFELIDYYTGFSITRAFSGNSSAFSTSPKQPPMYTRTETFDSKGRTLMRKTKIPANPAMNDSAVYSYHGTDSLSMQLYQGKNLIYECSKKFNSGRLVMVNETYHTNSQASSDVFTYDSEGRISSVSSSGDNGAADCGSGIGSSAEIRYNQFGLPQLIIFRGAGDFCALVFYYAY